MTIELKQITKQVGGEDHIYETDLTLAETGFNVLLGATGAGKTTLIKLMAGLERPTTGAILFDGEDVSLVSTQKRNVSLVHQFFINYANLTVFENIASPLRVAGLKDTEVKKRVVDAADLMRLTPMLDRRPQELSGGQQQRTALARAIVKDSRLVLLDEPLANLDYKLREELRDELPRLFADKGAVVVYATSEPTEALLLGGHTATMQEGRITQFGRAEAVYKNPANLRTADVFSDPPINTAEVLKERGEIHLHHTDGGEIAKWPAGQEIADQPDGAYRLGIRPHFVTPVADGDVPAEGSVPLHGTVLVTELSGSESVAHFEFGDLTWVAQSHGVHPYQIGERHDFRIDTGGCMYFDADGRRLGADAAGTPPQQPQQ